MCPPNALPAGRWPGSVEELVARQRTLADCRPTPWQSPRRALRIAACWVCFQRGGRGAGNGGEPAWVAGVLVQEGQLIARYVFLGAAGAPYHPGLLALRVGPLAERATAGLSGAPDVVLVDGTGRDHPRRAGLALHLGAVLGLPTVGVTHRPLLAEGAWPVDAEGESSPLTFGGEPVACWLRTRPGTRPLVVHPGWRTGPDTAVAVVREAAAGHRTPEPLRAARRLARQARSLA